MPKATVRANAQALPDPPEDLRPQVADARAAQVEKAESTRSALASALSTARLKKFAIGFSSSMRAYRTLWSGHRCSIRSPRRWLPCRVCRRGK